MRRWLLLQIPLAVVLLALGFGGGFAWSRFTVPTSTPTATPTSIPSQTPTATHTATATSSWTPTPSRTPTITNTPTPSLTPTITLTPSRTPRPSRTPTITPTPTYSPPQAHVLQQSNCRYGPGAAYLYEWGLYEGDRVEVFGRNPDASWAYIDPWTYGGRCWVKATLLDVFRGKLIDAPIYYGRLPQSDLYGPPTNVGATREGNRVYITWTPVWMTEDDDRGYLLETWVCRDGQIVFTPIHVNAPPAYVDDEPGCQQASSGRLYTAEKHGYTQWVKIPWPTFPASSPTPNP